MHVICTHLQQKENRSFTRTRTHKAGDGAYLVGVRWAAGGALPTRFKTATLGISKRLRRVRNFRSTHGTDPTLRENICAPTAPREPIPEDRDDDDDNHDPTIAT